MEAFDGVSLRAFLDGPACSRDEVRSVVAEIAIALTAARAHGIVNDWIQPEDILIARGNEAEHEVKVTVGLDRVREKYPKHSYWQPPRPLGISGCLAPEVIRGASEKGSRSTDVFTLAAIAFELIAGFPAWRAEEPILSLAAILKEPPSRLRFRHPSFVHLDAVEAVLRRALAKDPKERPQDAAAFVDEFERAV
jgi:serine/threonine-protein kinase